MMADLGIAEIRAEGRKMLAKYRNADGDSTDEAKAIELWFWGWVDELLRDPEGIDEDGIDHICDALMEVGPWDEIDGDGTEASIIADHIRDLPRLRSAPSLSPTVDDLEAYIDLALIRWVPGDDAGLARHIAESIHPRLVPVSPSVDPEEEP